MAVSNPDKSAAPDFEQLTQNPEKYQLFYTLRHDKIIDFVREYYGAHTPWLQRFKYFLHTVLALWLGLHIIFWWKEQLSLLQMMECFGWGFLSFFVIVPLHEWIHGLFYRIAGAKKIRYKAQWRKLVFSAEAPFFVIDYPRFFALAVAPFFIINSILTILLLLGIVGIFDTYISAILLSALLVHTNGCIGDFTLISFFEQHGREKIYTFDDSDAGLSYFYVETEAAPES